MPETRTFKDERARLASERLTRRWETRRDEMLAILDQARAAPRSHVVRSRPCECGCGGMTKPRPGRRQNRFVKGHESRGRKLSDEHKEKIGASSRGKTRGPYTQERRDKIGEALRGRQLPEAHRLAAAAATPRGEMHPLWKGEDAGYIAIHIWVRRHKPKTGVCQQCDAKRYTEFGNVSGAYLRDLDDYIELCKPCHIALDRSRPAVRRPHRAQRK